MRLIDADELKKWLKSPAGFRANCEDCVTADCLNCIIEEAIENAPTIEAAPVVHGRWIGPTRVDANNNKYECSECGFWGVPGWAACPKCTAKMDGGVCDG